MLPQPTFHTHLPAVPEADPYKIYLDSLPSAESRRAMRGCLDRIAQLASTDPSATGAGQPWHLLRYQQTSAIRATMLQQGWSPAYINKHLVALRRVLQEALHLGQITADDYQQAIRVKAVKSSRLPRGHHVPAEVVGAALAACDADPSPAGRRDAAILAVLHSTGCRRAELAGLRAGDYDRAERSLQVIGKRDKQRTVYLNVAAMARLEAWLAVRGTGDGALFPPLSAAGNIRKTTDGPVPMTGQSVANILNRRLAAAGAPTATPHDLRRTFIGEMLDAGVDLATTQQIVGHSSPDTTARYDRRPQRRRREAVDRLALPEAKPLW